MKTITRIKYYILCGVSTILFGLASCTDYLDRDPESIISEETAFLNFMNFQGFTEEMYVMIPDIAKHYWVSSFNWGEDEIITIGAGEYLMGFHFDRGNYRAHINKHQTGFRKLYGAVLGQASGKPIWVWRR